MVRKLKKKIIDLIVNIILDYLKKTEHNVYLLLLQIYKEVLCKSMKVPSWKKSSETFK